MSELINNSKYRKEKLKELILKLHKGEDPALVRTELISTLRNIPYGEVVEVEQELISEHTNSSFFHAITSSWMLTSIISARSICFYQ